VEQVNSPSQEIVDAAVSEGSVAIGQGRVAGSVPALSTTDPGSLGLAVARLNGQVLTSGDADERFSIQSVSKLFAFASLLRLEGTAAWDRVRWLPSVSRYDSLAELEAHDGQPRNPFVNAGAMLVVDRLMSLTGRPTLHLLTMLRRESGAHDICVDERVRRSEAAHGHRNSALGHFLASYGLMQNGVDEVLHEYYSQCSISASCRELATAGLFLANRGVSASGQRFLESHLTRTLNAVLLTAGTYNGAGDFAYRVGLPAKSGIGGGILAVMPGEGVVCVWSPALDHFGTSAAGVATLEAFTRMTEWSIFEDTPASDSPR
jgi:glutaminase